MSDEQPFLPFAKPDIGEAEIAEVVDALRSGWVTTGPRTRQFEQDFVAYLQGELETSPSGWAEACESVANAEPLQALAVNSATAGLHLALEALGVGPGDEVIVPDYTFTATAEVVRYLGATPVVVDVCENTFNISVEAVAQAITPQTRVMIPVHFAGMSCDMPALLELARVHDVRVVEDAAHALPTSSNGQPVGTLKSDATVFSFYANKTMTTGEGGMLVTRNPALAERARVMRLHGISKDAFDRYSSTKPAWFYQVIAPGYKYNMTDIAAALGIHQLRRATGFQQVRERQARVYHEAFADCPVVSPPDAPEGDLHARHLYPLRLLSEAGVSRDEFIVKMAERGIGCSVHFIPLHEHPYWHDSLGLRAEQFPVSNRLFQQEVSLPLYTLLSEADQQRVITAVREVLQVG